MKTMKLTLLVVMTAAIGAAGSQGQESRTDINPALLYYQAFSAEPTSPKADSDYLFTTNWRGRVMDERFGKLIADYDTEFRFVRLAARSTAPCDWGIDWRQGPNTLLEHLARCKRMAQAGKLRVQWDLQNGKEAEARDDLLATLALGRNSSRDGSLISALVEVAIENIVCTTVAENFYRFTPEALKQLADGFDAAPARGTMAAAILTEKKLGPDWVVNKILALRKEHPGDDAKVVAEAMKALYPPDQGETNVESPAMGASGQTSEDLLNLFRDEDPFYDRLAAIMALPQPEYEVQMKAFTAEVDKSTNIMFKLTYPAISKGRTREFVTLARLAMVKAAVEYKLHGEEGLKSVRDPFGNGPFGYERFMFEGVDRGFKLTSAYAGGNYPTAEIFVEKGGPPFICDGTRMGQPWTQ